LKSIVCSQLLNTQLKITSWKTGRLAPHNHLINCRSWEYSTKSGNAAAALQPHQTALPAVERVPTITAAAAAIPTTTNGCSYKSTSACCTSAATTWNWCVLHYFKTLSLYNCVRIASNSSVITTSKCSYVVFFPLFVISLEL